MKWRMKILLMCLACTMSALVLQTVLFQNTSSRLLTHRVEAETVGSLRNLQNSIYSYLNNMESNLIKIYDEDAVVDALNKGTNAKTLQKEFANLARDFTLSAFETSDGVRALYLYNAEHQVISAYRRYVTPKHNYPTDIFLDPQYNGDTIRSYIESSDTGMMISSYYNTHREKDIVHLVMKIFAGYQYDRAVGYIVCDVDSDTIAALMKKCIADPTQYVWLQPSGDRVAMSIGMLEEDQQADFQQISEEVAGRGTGCEPEELADTRLFRVEQTRYDLTAYSLMPQEILLQNQAALSMSLATIAALMILVAVILTSAVVRSMTRPLDRLTKTIDRIKAGQTQLRVLVDRNDELGMLSQNVNEMLDNLEDFRIKEQEHIRLLDQAEYRALQAQINPHFLYNTLETMAGIAEMEECSQVSGLCYSLSRIFRYSLNTKEGLSTVAKEIEHLKNYTYIMSERMHDDAVEYSYDIAPEVLHAPIPRLSLQPLVENALNHGLKNRAGQKTVAISAKFLGDDLVIRVADNGTGMDAEAMNRRLSGDDLRRATTGTAIGLGNINARLKLLYGERYGLWIESEPGRGTVVTMTLPGRKAENTDE